MTAKLPSLDQIDPTETWQPWRPSSSDPWGRKWAAHLYRRAAFGPSRAELLEAERLGFERTLDLLMQGRLQGEEQREATLTDIGRVAAADNDEQLRAWWVYCMLNSGHPVREKLTLFWHNHFATSIVKVQNAPLMFRQNCLLRRHALGKFGPFLQAVSKDGAMLVWLDSNSNVKGKPNENYARELMELFSLGVSNYTEKDIREGARAFTGWHTDGEGYRFKADSHDYGPKTILGQTGAWDGGDVVRIALTQPAAARFLIRKLYQFLVSENATPPDSLLEPLCERFRKSNYDIAVLVRTMLASRHFYSHHAFRQRIKSPVEFVLGAVQTVYRRYGEKEADYRPLPTEPMVGWLNAMGQTLFAPPNVKGWRGGRAWLNTSTVLARNNFAAALSMGSLWTSQSPAPGEPVTTVETAQESPLPKAFDPARVLQEERVNRPEEVARELLDLYVPGGARADASAKLTAFLSDGKPVGAGLESRVREAAHAIMSMAEYQLA
ncbi:MAG TPA: DUF1800 domain-containing protein [Gemmataceae bacterium]|jgi:hypothetical protein